MVKFNNKSNEVIVHEGRTVWLSRSCAVVGMVWLNVEGELYILINKRGQGAADYRGKYNLPCGYLDYNETLLQASIREIYEETGLFVANEFSFSEQPIFVSSDPENNRQNISNYFKFYNTCSKERFEYLKSLLTNEYSETGEVEEILFMKFEDLDKYDFCFNHEKRIKQFRYEL